MIYYGKLENCFVGIVGSFLPSMMNIMVKKTIIILFINAQNVIK